MNYKLSITLAVLYWSLWLPTGSGSNGRYTLRPKHSAALALPRLRPLPRELVSGIDQSGFNESIRPQDDFFDYVNGTWVENTEIPSDKARWGTFDALGEQSQRDVRALVEEVSAAQGRCEAGTPKQKIRDFYNAYMDTEAATAKGIEAIREEP